MKNSTTKILTIAVVLLLLLNVAMLVFILRGKGKHDNDNDRGKGGPFEMMVKELNMTTEQQTAYKQLKEDHFANTRPLFDSLRAAKQAFFALSRQDNVSDSLVNAYSDRVTAIQSATDKLILAHFRKVRMLFKDEQQKKFDDFVQKMMQRGPGRKRDSLNKEKRD